MNPAATEWIDARLAEHGLRRTGDLEPRAIRPWAAVHRVPVGDGVVWFKAPAATLPFEVPLSALLGRVAPEHVLTPLAADERRGWLLLPDGGPSLGERFEGAARVDTLSRALTRYAELQRALMPRVGELLALGVEDMRPEVMPARFDEAFAVARERADPAKLERVAAMRPQVEQWSARLAAGPVPPSLDHNDLDPGHVLGDLRVYDWGDAVVAHPFTTIRALGWWRLEEPDVVRLRDAYLEPFADLAPHAELVEAVELAGRVAKIARALVWHRSVRLAKPGEIADEWFDGPAEALLTLLDDTWRGTV